MGCTSSKDVPIPIEINSGLINVEHRNSDLKIEVSETLVNASNSSDSSLVLQNAILPSKTVSVLANINNSTPVEVIMTQFSNSENFTMLNSNHLELENCNEEDKSFAVKFLHRYSSDKLKEFNIVDLSAIPDDSADQAETNELLTTLNPDTCSSGTEMSTEDNADENDGDRNFETIFDDMNVDDDATISLSTVDEDDDFGDSCGSKEEVYPSSWESYDQPHTESSSSISRVSIANKMPGLPSSLISRMTRAALSNKNKNGNNIDGMQRYGNIEDLDTSDGEKFGHHVDDKCGRYGRHRQFSLDRFPVEYEEDEDDEAATAHRTGSLLLGHGASSAVNTSLNHWKPPPYEAISSGDFVTEQDQYSHHKLSSSTRIANNRGTDDSLVEHLDSANVKIVSRLDQSEVSGGDLTQQMSTVMKTNATDELVTLMKPMTRSLVTDPQQKQRTVQSTSATQPVDTRLNDSNNYLHHENILPSTEITKGAANNNNSSQQSHQDHKQEAEAEVEPVSSTSVLTALSSSPKKNKSSEASSTSATATKSRFLEYKRLMCLSAEDMAKELAYCIDDVIATHGTTKHALCLAIVKARFDSGNAATSLASSLSSALPPTPRSNKSDSFNTAGAEAPQRLSPPTSAAGIDGNGTGLNAVNSARSDESDDDSGDHINLGATMRFDVKITHNGATKHSNNHRLHTSQNNSSSNIRLYPDGEERGRGGGGGGERGVRSAQAVESQHKLPSPATSSPSSLHSRPSTPTAKNKSPAKPRWHDASTATTSGRLSKLLERRNQIAGTTSNNARLSIQIETPTGSKSNPTQSAAGRQSPQIQRNYSSSLEYSTTARSTLRSNSLPRLGQLDTNHVFESNSNASNNDNAGRRSPGRPNSLQVNPAWLSQPLYKSSGASASSSSSGPSQLAETPSNDQMQVDKLAAGHRSREDAPPRGPTRAVTTSSMKMSSTGQSRATSLRISGRELNHTRHNNKNNISNTSDGGTDNVSNQQQYITPKDRIAAANNDNSSNRHHHTARAAARNHDNRPSSAPARSTSNEHPPHSITKTTSILQHQDNHEDGQFEQQDKKQCEKLLSKPPKSVKFNLVPDIDIY